MSASDADRSALADVHAAWVSAVTAGDAESLRALVTDDYEVWANAARSITGHDAVVSAMRAALERFRIQLAVVTPLHELLIVALVAHILRQPSTCSRYDVERHRNLDGDSGLAPRASATAT